MAEVEGIEKRWSLFKNAQDIVDEKFEDGRDYAIDALRTATETITELKEVASQLNEIDIDVTLPYITPPDIGTFTATPPVAPSVDINFPDAPSDTDEVQSAIHDKLLSDIQNGSPAIPQAIEDAVFERESERALLVQQDTLDKISSEWAKRGFTLPNGILAAQITQSQIDYGNKRLDISRDISIKSFELSDTNTKFAIQQGLAFLANRIAVYKVEVDAEIARIDAIIKKYLGETEVYKGTAQVFTALADIDIKIFEAELRAEIAQAELVMKNADIDIKNFEVVNGLKSEAMKAIGGINAQIVAGALSSVSASASIQASNSGSYSYSTNPSY